MNNNLSQLVTDLKAAIPNEVHDFKTSVEIEDNNDIIDDIDNNDDITVYTINVEYSCKLLSYLNFFKFHHWAATSIQVHKLLDTFYKILSDYTDEVAEVLQGIDGQFKMHDMNIEQLDAKYSVMDALNMLKQDVQNFIDDCDNDMEYSGAVDISTTLLKDIAQYAYLFRLCK